MLLCHLVRDSKTFDRDARLRRDRVETQDVGVFVCLGSIALRGEHPEHRIARHDRHDDARLGRDELARLGAVEQPDRRPLGGPATHEPRRLRSNDLAGEALAQRERAALVLDATVDLPDDFDGLARFVVHGEEEDRRVQHPSGLVVQRPEQLEEVARVDAERSEACRGFESRAKLLVHRQRFEHGIPIVERVRRRGVRSLRRHIGSLSRAPARERVGVLGTVSACKVACRCGAITRICQ